jgi:hypothetical protein
VATHVGYPLLGASPGDSQSRRSGIEISKTTISNSEMTNLSF